ncbi:restriction endonuclease subunit S [Camelimonas sp. ID_303_24]
MDDWRETRLADLIDIKHGFAFRGEHFCDEPTDSILVTPGNFAIGGGFQLNKAKYYNGIIPNDYVLSTGDVIVTMTDLSKNADTLGYSATVPISQKRFLHNQRIGKVIQKSENTCLSFIAWLMRTSAYRDEILGSATGSTVKHTSPSRILSYAFRLPPLAVQRQIVGVLSSLEDKIELNRRMNETLEAMAQAIFRDWFVDFGPVRRKLAGVSEPVPIMGGLTPDPPRAAELAALFPDQLGDDGLPVGWRLGAVGDIIEFNPTEYLSKGAVAPYSDMSSLPTSGSCAEQPTLRAYGSGMKFRNGDAILARITPCLENGKAAFIDFLPDNATIGWGSTEFIVHRAKSGVPKPLAYIFCRDPEYRMHAIQSMIGTSGRQRAQADSLKALPFALPSIDVFAAFGDHIDVSFAKISMNSAENRTLAETRDYLLPRLMSGEVSVRDTNLESIA